MKKIKLILIIVSCAYVSHAQIDYNIVPDVTSTYLINDVHIIKSPTDSFGLGDILIENGLIKKVARQIDPPIDAQVIEADSAYAYAAFIDGLSHTGIAKSEGKEDRPKVKFPGAAPNDVAGITPEKLAAEMVSGKESSIKSMRESGFAISHTAPSGKMLPGTGALIALSRGDAEDLVMKEKASIYMQFSGSRGVYPSTIIGVMAKWRNLYKNAQGLSDHRRMYKTNTQGMQRPKKDKSLQALIPLTNKEMSLFAKASKPKEIFRALQLKKELGYNLVLTNVKYVTPALQKVKQSGAHILLSTSLPKEEKKDKKSDKAKSDDKKEEKEKNPEKEALEKRKKETLKSYKSQAMMLEKERIPFGFSLMGAKPANVKKNILKMIEQGLSQEAALAALTTNPAKILGIDNVTGTLSEGKLANIMISTQPYFDKESAIKYMFVEGSKYEMEVKEKAAEGEAGEVAKSLVGAWSYDIEIPGDGQSGTIFISDAGVIEVEGDDEPGDKDEAENVKFNEDNVLFTLTVVNNGMELIVDFDLNFAGDSFEGNISVAEFGSFPISGSKKSSPE